MHQASQPLLPSQDATVPHGVVATIALLRGSTAEEIVAYGESYGAST